MPDWIGEPAADPIRTRLNFFNVLAPEECGPVIERMMAATRAAATRTAVIRDQLKASGKTVEALAVSGAHTMLLARLSWLEEVRACYA